MQRPVRPYKEITTCRICGNPDLAPVLDLGIQALTGVFPKDPAEKITAGPLELVKCREYGDEGTCGLLQLRHSYCLDEMYGMNYGYRSGLNASMVQHLRSIVARACSMVELAQDDLVLDIGSNDGTLLSFYPECGVIRVGMDPTAKKFEKYYPKGSIVIEDFFSGFRFRKEFGSNKAKIVTCIAMFYDLESPQVFVSDVCDILSEDGIWIFEQSYMPTMLQMTAYDTVCHEHLEYYGMRQICWLIKRSGLKVIDVELNDVNGGSFCVVAAKKSAKHPENLLKVQRFLETEMKLGLHEPSPYNHFADKVVKHRNDLRIFLQQMKRDGKKLLGYGASTKGNVILQYCGLGPSDIPCIAEVNEDKFGRYTPGTLIPIVSEDEARNMRPDYFLVLPWHFKEHILIREKDFSRAGGRFLFPLPWIHVV